MSKEKREEQVKVINSLLELKRKVVGVKFYYDEEEYEACPAQQVKYYMTKDEYCCVFGFSDTLVEDHPEVAKNYVKALSMACDFISENPVEAAKLCYENGYVADEDYEFNGKLLESYRYKFNYEDAKASFVDVTKDLNDLGIITLNKSADELADETFVNAGQVK